MVCNFHKKWFHLVVPWAILSDLCERGVKCCCYECFVYISVADIIADVVVINCRFIDYKYFGSPWYFIINIGIVVLINISEVDYNFCRMRSQAQGKTESRN